MGKNQGSAARRAKKKHEKELKRRKALGRRPASALPLWPAPHEPAPWILAPPEPAPAAFDWSALREGITALMKSRYITSYYQAADTLEHLQWPRGLHPAWRDDLWTPSRVARLQTSELLERLAELGIPAIQGDFFVATARFASAVDLARELWLPLLAASADGLTRDFVCLAACELWKRWSPDSPSREMLLDPLLAGDEACYQEDGAGAVTQWIAFWNRLKPLLSPEMRTTEAADPLLGGYSTSLADWAEGFSLYASSVASSDPEIGRAAASALEEVLSQFADECPEWRIDVAEEIAVALDVTGQRERAEALLRDLIAQHPDHAGGYVDLADLWAPYRCDDCEALGRSLALLERAAAYPVQDGVFYDLERRIQDLRKKLAPARLGSG